MEFVTAGTVIDDPGTDGRTEVLASPLETGDRYRLRGTMPVGSRGPGCHRHPALTETFIVRSGDIGFRLGRHVTVLHAGQGCSVPPGATHTFWNLGSEPAEIDAEIIFEPPEPLRESDVVRFGAEYAYLVREGRHSSFLHIALLLDQYPKAFALPGPLVVQRMLIRPAAALARRLGYRTR
jgi:mannose-6-phosphate isomerase-like protein (cupin superfamily)